MLRIEGSPAIALCTLGLLCVWLSCAVTQAAEGGADSKDDLKAVGDATNALGFDLYQALSSGQENLAFSPLSVETALALTYGGARGQTAEQMRQVLHSSLPANRLHPAFGELLEQLMAAPPRDPGQPEASSSQLTVANALWAQQDYAFQPPFLNLAEKYYFGGL